MDLDAQLAAIRSDPDDDAPRAALAAWWSQQGDPRGPFVAAQLRAAGLPRWHPERPALLAEAERLLAGHRDAWLADVPHGPLAVSFVRGFVGTADGEPAEVRDHLPALLAAAPVQRLELAADEADDGPADPAVEDLHRCTALGALHELTFHDGELHPDRLAGLLAAPVWRALRALAIGEPMCAAEHVAALAATALPEAVRSLRFEGHMGGMGDGGVDALLRAPWLGQLDLLTLNGQSLGDASLAALSASALRLQTLGISSAGYGEHTFSAEAVRAAAASPLFRGLRTLSLCGAPVGEALPELVAACRELRSASLSRTGLDGDDLRLLVRAATFEGWQELSLAANPIGDGGARMLSMCHRLPRVLSLAGCGISPTGLGWYASAPPVDALDLRSNPLPAAAWQQLLDDDRLPKATALLADAHDWSPELVAAIRARYPRVDLTGAAT
jgi:uncharacterized protein (TIGR02996 family)